MNDYDALEKELRVKGRKLNDEGNHELGNFLWETSIAVGDLWAKLKGARAQLLEEVELNKRYKCFHCGEHTVTWDADFSFEDYGEEGEGIIQECHCTNCGARITYRIPLDEEVENE